ncbi:MAG: hypothetical protein ABI026_05550 [Gemmatimonadaceae bacterium]
MYSTCLFCHHDLGANKVVEHFPIGRRLAFDQAKGRLWVVCKSCERWNLTPVAERWEAIEECEKLFRDTTLRMSTDHIGLARVSEGLELVRVGQPQRPEMAAWRYGDQFGRRRKRYMMMTGAGVVAAGALISGYAALGLLAGGGGTLLNVGSISFQSMRRRRIAARVPTPQGVLEVTHAQLPEAKIVRSDDTRWQLSLVYQAPRGNNSVYKWYEYDPRSKDRRRTLLLDPDDALPAVAALLPRVNGSGGSARHVQTAVGLVEDAGHATRLLETAARVALKGRWNPFSNGSLSTIPLEARLALEMMTHEADERRALEGELAVLEARWKEAEEIAGISDNMFLPASVTGWIKKIHT